MGAPLFSGPTHARWSSRPAEGHTPADEPLAGTRRHAAAAVHPERESHSARPDLDHSLGGPGAWLSGLRSTVRDPLLQTAASKPVRKAENRLGSGRIAVGQRSAGLQPGVVRGPRSVSEAWSDRGLPGDGLGYGGHAADQSEPDRQGRLERFHHRPGWRHRVQSRRQLRVAGQRPEGLVRLADG